MSREEVGNRHRAHRGRLNPRVPLVPAQPVSLDHERHPTQGPVVRTPTTPSTAATPGKRSEDADVML